MDVSAYTVEVIRVGRVSVCIQIIEPGASGIAIRRLKTIHKDLKEKVYRTLVEQGIPPKWHRYHRWAVISPLTPTNVQSLMMADEVKLTHHRLLHEDPLTPLPDDNSKLTLYTPNQQTAPLLLSITDANKSDIIKQLELVLDKL